MYKRRLREKLIPTELNINWKHVLYLTIKFLCSQKTKNLMKWKRICSIPRICRNSFEWNINFSLWFMSFSEAQTYNWIVVQLEFFVYLEWNVSTATRMDDKVCAFPREKVECIQKYNMRVVWPERVLLVT